jgi:hypothetical protein
LPSGIARVASYGAELLTQDTSTRWWTAPRSTAAAGGPIPACQTARMTMPVRGQGESHAWEACAHIAACCAMGGGHAIAGPRIVQPRGGFVSHRRWATAGATPAWPTICDCGTVVRGGKLVDGSSAPGGCRRVDRDVRHAAGMMMAPWGRMANRCSASGRRAMGSGRRARGRERPSR